MSDQPLPPARPERCPTCLSENVDEPQRKECAFMCPPANWRWVTDEFLNATDFIVCADPWHDQTGHSTPATPQEDGDRELWLRAINNELANLREWANREAKRAERAESESASLKAEVERLREERDKYALLASEVECYWDEDGDHRFESPESYADECDLKVGDTFKLQAANYWYEEFRVTKVPDPPEAEVGNDDYKCEEIGKKHSEFETYFAMKDRAEKAESELAALRQKEGKKL